jgi:hypothetical protein
MFKKKKPQQGDRQKLYILVHIQGKGSFSPLHTEIISCWTSKELLDAIKLRLGQYSMCDSTGEIDSWEFALSSLNSGLEVSFCPKGSNDFFGQEICQVKCISLPSSN